ncbi:MAG: type II toxin-antitoxin system VapC family toxin [Chloroflexota bacterium]
MFIVVDASVWVARLVAGDVFHEPVKVWMNERLEARDVFLSPSLLLPEVGGAISRRTTSALGLKAVETLQSLPGLQLVEMERPLVREAAHLAAELGLRGADSIYVAVASQLDLPLFTLDVDQKEKAGKRVKVVGL